MSEPPVPASAFADAWTQVDRTDDPAFFVGVLDATRAGMLERARRSPAEFFAPLAVERGQRVLDVGCGTGDLLRLLAPLVAPGEAVGIDLSETMISEARTRAAVANLEFHIGDVQALTFADGSFDRVLATQVLLHVPQPEVALGEMARVLAPDGLLAISEIDWNSITIESTDRELARRFSALACDGLRNGLIVRRLPAMLRSLGFEVVQVRPEVAVGWEPDAFHEWFLRPALAHFVRVGGFSSEEAEWLLHDLDELAGQGRYFTARTTYAFTARRKDRA